MGVGMRVETYRDLHLDMCFDMCLDVCLDIRIDVFLGMCLDMYSDHELRRLFRHVLKSGHVSVTWGNTPFVTVSEHGITCEAATIRPP